MGASTNDVPPTTPDQAKSSSVIDSGATERDSRAWSGGMDFMTFLWLQILFFEVMFRL